MTSLVELAKKIVFGESKIKRPLSHHSLYSEMGYPTENLDLVMLRKIVIREPLLFKAILKKNKDVIKNWFVIKHEDDDKEVPKEVLDIIYKFDTKTQFPKKLFIAGIAGKQDHANVRQTLFYLASHYQPAIRGSINIHNGHVRRQILYGQ